jgi:hypothetical protein
MLPLLLALIATAEPSGTAVPLGQTAWIFSTIGHSEFCNPGHVRLDLQTGRYSLTARAPRRVCDKPGLERPVRNGTLGGKTLGALRLAYQRVLANGLESPACREGRRPKGIIIDNGGTPILLVATGRAVGSAPDDLTCWSEAATSFHDALDEAFGARNWR